MSDPALQEIAMEDDDANSDDEVVNLEEPRENDHLEGEESQRADQNELEQGPGLEEQEADNAWEWNDEKELEKEFGIRLSVGDPDFQFMEMELRNQPIRDLWKEWFYGDDEKPSICQMELHHGSRWHPGNFNASTYLFMKRLVYAALRETIQVEADYTLGQ
ncbi:hypothetical protein BGZ58_000278 [Dissophora ornata]|nr:hypothetical protein BGZ58_000278 [Dissophora ornata]